MSSVVTNIRGLRSHDIMPSDNENVSFFKNFVCHQVRSIKRTRRGEVIDPNIVIIKWAPWKCHSGRNLFNCYLELFVFFSATVDVIVCIFLFFLEPGANVLAQGKHAKLLLSLETFTLMKTCCTFLAQPEVCQVRREVSLCPLGSKIGQNAEFYQS